MVDLLKYIEIGERNCPKLGSKEAIELMKYLTKQSKSIICKDSNLNLRGSKIINNKRIAGYSVGNIDNEETPISSITKASIIRDALEHDMLIAKLIDGKDKKRLLLEVADGIKGFINNYNGKPPKTPFPIMPEIFPNLEVWKVINSASQLKEINELKFKTHFNRMEDTIKSNISTTDTQSKKIIYKNKYLTKNIVNYFIDSGISIKQNRLLLRDNTIGTLFLLGSLESSKGFTIYQFHDFQTRLIYQMFNEKRPIPSKQESNQQINHENETKSKESNQQINHEDEDKSKESHFSNNNEYISSNNPKEFYINQDIIKAYKSLNSDLNSIKNVVENKFLEGNKKINENLTKHNYYNAKNHFDVIIKNTNGQLDKSFAKGLNIEQTLNLVLKRINEKLIKIDRQLGMYILNPNQEVTNDSLKLIKSSELEKKNIVYTLNVVKKYFLNIKEFKKRFEHKNSNNQVLENEELESLNSALEELSSSLNEFITVLSKNISKTSIENGYGKFIANAEKQLRDGKKVYSALKQEDDSISNRKKLFNSTLKSIEAEIKQIKTYSNVLKSKFSDTTSKKQKPNNEIENKENEENESTENKEIKNLLKVDSSGKSPYKKAISTLKVPYGANEFEMTKSILSFFRRNLSDEASKLSFEQITSMYKEIENEINPHNPITKIEKVEPSETLFFTKKNFRLSQFLKSAELSEDNFLSFNVYTKDGKDSKSQVVISKNSVFKNNVCGYGYVIKDNATKIGSTRLNSALNILLSYKIRLSLKEYGVPISRTTTTLTRLGTEPMKNCYYAIKFYLEDGKGTDALIHSVEDEIFVSSSFEEREATKNSVATVFDTKKNINTTTQSLMDNSKFLGRIFDYVEYDDEVKKEDVLELEKRFTILEPSLPQLTEKLELRVRKLGRHRFNGAYRHSQKNKTICINVRDISSFVHEYGHAIDYNFKNDDNNLSLSSEFSYILRTINRNLKDNKLINLQYASYFRTPTEVFARCYELYFYSKHGAVDLSHDEKRFESEEYDVIRRDKALYNEVLDYFNKLI